MSDGNFMQIVAPCHRDLHSPAAWELFKKRFSEQVLFTLPYQVDPSGDASGVWRLL